ncbi:MAG: hypothetical protein Q8P41_07640 [Pseudomonadota bacterium]|nr:hypothetical protein [Pseudomonadota bacterium]
MPARLALIALLAGCTSGDAPADTAPGFEARDCGAILWDETFRSIDELECGLGPDGPVLCHWTLAFGTGTYTWDYSDISESGTVTCADNELTGASSGGTPRQGTVHRTTNRVTWEGVAYGEAE